MPSGKPVAKGLLGYPIDWFRAGEPNRIKSAGKSQSPDEFSAGFLRMERVFGH